MDKEEKEKSYPRTNKRVSLFKRRKKPQERPLVRVRKQKSYKRLVINISLVVLGLFILATALYIIKNTVISKFAEGRRGIIAPQANPYPDDNQIKNVIQNSGLQTSGIIFATNSATVTFYFKKDTFVLMSTKKDIRNQLDLVEAISLQLMSEGKRAIYIDLRYNKPIVKF